MTQDKIVIGIRGCIFSPWDKQWKECMDTWGAVMESQGYNLKVLMGHPELKEDYIELDRFLFSKSTETRYGVFYKHIYYPCKWFLNETNYDHIYIVGDDTFVHPQKFFSLYEGMRNHLDFNANGGPHYWGAATPRLQNWGRNVKDFRQNFKEAILYLSGGSGMVLSRKAAQVIVESFESGEWAKWEKPGIQFEGFPEFTIPQMETSQEWLYMDDLLTGLILYKNHIWLTHDDAFSFESPFKPQIGPFYPGMEKHIPYIGGKNGEHLVAQHFVAGKMHEIMDFLDLWKEIK